MSQGTGVEEPTSHGQNETHARWVVRHFRVHQIEAQGCREQGGDCVNADTDPSIMPYYQNNERDSAGGIHKPVEVIECPGRANIAVDTKHGLLFEGGLRIVGSDGC